MINLIDDKVLTPDNRFDPMITDADGRVYFRRHELACKGSGLIVLAPGFAQHLFAFRVELGEPVIPTSVCRSLEHNRNVRGHPRSLHVYDRPHWPTEGTCALDFKVLGAGYRARSVECLLDLGWSVGVHGAFTHADRRTDYTDLERSMFLY